MNYRTTASMRSSRFSARHTTLLALGCSANRCKSPMNAALFKAPARATCSTNNAKAPSSAATLPAWRSNLSASVISIVPVSPVNLPESIVHGEMPLPMRKTALCLDGGFLTSARAFQ